MFNFFNGYSIRKNVHVYRQGDLNVVYDVNTGSLHILDDVTYNILKTIEKVQDAGETVAKESFRRFWDETQGNIPADEELAEILQEFAALRQDNSLFTPEPEEKGPEYPEKPIIKAICLHVAHDCNMRCEYCFAGTGPFGGNRMLMTLETAKKAVDFVIAASAHRNHCEVDFFGGEPLLNLPVVKELVKYGREQAAKHGKTIKFTMTTNGSLLDEEVQTYLEEEDMSVVLSLDGRPEVHDRMRPNTDGSGSYEEVIPHIKELVARRPDSPTYTVGTYYYVRGTYTHFNLDFDRDVFHMVDEGIKQISLEPVVAQPSDSYAFQEGDLPVIMESYDRLAEEYLARRAAGQDFNFFHFNIALDRGPCLPKRLTGCGAGHEYVAISPEGDIFPCHQYVGQEKYRMGSLWSENPLELNSGLVQAFRSAHIYAKPECQDCWARFNCSGGCHAANTAFTDDLNKVYALGCELQKKRLEVGLYVKIKEAQRDPASLITPPIELHC